MALKPKTRIITFIFSLLILGVAGFIFYKITVKADSTFTMDEGGGTTVGSATSGGASGTITNAVWKTQNECIAGPCLYFDGDGDLVNFGDAASLDFAETDNFTLVAWFRHSPTISATQMIISKYNDAAGTDGGYQLYMDATGHIVFGIDSDQTSFPSDSVTSVNTFNDNLWHVAVAVKTGTTRIDLYVDGKADGVPDTSITNLTLVNSDTFYLGMDSDGSSSDWSGYLDEVQVLSSAKTASQVVLLSTRPPSRSTTGQAAAFGADTSYLSQGLLGYWKLDEASGNVSDSSGNGYTLTNNGTTTFVPGKFGNGSEHVPASTQYLSTATSIAGIKSVSFWTNPDATTNYFINLTATQSIDVSSGTVRANNITGAIIYVNGSPGTTIIADVWQHITVTWPTAITADTFYVGRIGSSYYDGTLDEVRLYNRTLNPGEVQALSVWTADPMIYYKFDENSGTVARDSANNYDGTLGNGTAGYVPAWSQGYYGPALKFDGTDDMVNTNINTSLSVYTIEAWIKRDTANANGRIFDKREAGSEVMNAYFTGNSLALNQFFTGAQGQWIANTDIALNQWHHIAITFDATSASNNPLMYYDGISQSIAENMNPTSGTISTNADDYIIGNRGAADRAYDGSIDEFRIYNYIRTPAQILEDMNASRPPPLTSVVNYGFNEHTGTALHNTGMYGATADATSSGALWNLNGKVDSALQFNGTTSYVSSPKLDFMGPSTYSEVSWGGWVNPTTSAVSKSLLIKDTEFKLETDANSKANCSIYSGSWQTAAVSTTALPVNAWTHVMCTYNRNLISVYINGKLEATAAQTGLITSASTTGLNIGWNSAGGSYFAGLLDQIGIYGRNLTANEVKSVYNQTSSAVLGSTSDTSGLTGGSNASNSATAAYCVPGDTTACAPPFAEWKLDENSGTTLNNSGTTAYTCTDASAAWKPGKFGSAAVFSGACADTNELDGTAQFTLEYWVKLSAYADWSNHLYKTSGTTSRIAIQEYNSGLIYAFIGNVDDTYGRTQVSVVPLDTWTHIAVTYNGGGAANADRLKIYINGVGKTLTFSGTVPATTASNANSFTIGAANRTKTFDTVRIFNYARTPEQIAWDYNGGAPFAYYKFDEGTNGTAYNSALTSNNVAAGLNGTLSAGDASGTNDTTADMWAGGITGKYNSSLEFDGVNDTVTVADDDQFSFGNATVSRPFSISAWVYMNDSTSSEIASKMDETTGAEAREFQFHFSSSDYLTFNVYDETNNGYIGRRWASAFPQSSWHHVVATYNGGTASSGIKLYVDGKQVDDTDNNSGSFTAINNTATPLEIGYYIGTGGTNTYLFDGQMDDLRFYNYDLSPTQVKSIYNLGAVRF